MYMSFPIRPYIYSPLFKKIVSGTPNFDDGSLFLERNVSSHVILPILFVNPIFDSQGLLMASFGDKVDKGASFSSQG